MMETRQEEEENVKLLLTRMPQRIQSRRRLRRLLLWKSRSSINTWHYPNEGYLCTDKTKKACCIGANEAMRRDRGIPANEAIDVIFSQTYLPSCGAKRMTTPMICNSPNLLRLSRVSMCDKWNPHGPL